METKKIKCYKCKKVFEDVNYKKEYGTATRLYCDKCTKKIYENYNTELLKWN